MLQQPPLQKFLSNSNRHIHSIPWNHPLHWTVHPDWPCLGQSGFYNMHFKRSLFELWSTDSFTSLHSDRWACYPLRCTKTPWNMRLSVWSPKEGYGWGLFGLMDKFQTINRKQLQRTRIYWSKDWKKNKSRLMLLLSCCCFFMWDISAKQLKSGSLDSGNLERKCDPLSSCVWLSIVMLVWTHRHLLKSSSGLTFRVDMTWCALTYTNLTGASIAYLQSLQFISLVIHTCEWLLQPWSGCSAVRMHLHCVSI